jgi:hypothetical protein
MTEKKYNKQNLTPWKPGQSGNPNGRPARSKEHKQFERLTKEKYINILQRCLYKSLEQLEEMFRDKSNTALELWVISIMIDGIKKGDDRKIETVLGRIIGKQETNIKVGLSHAEIINLVNDLENNES